MNPISKPDIVNFEWLKEILRHVTGGCVFGRWTSSPFLLRKWANEKTGTSPVFDTISLFADDTLLVIKYQQKKFYIDLVYRYDFDQKKVSYEGVEAILDNVPLENLKGQKAFWKSLAEMIDENKLDSFCFWKVEKDKKEGQ